MQRNPGFDGPITPTIENGELPVLKCNHTQVADLTPLRGMKLAGLTKLDLSGTKVGDAGLVHFKDCSDLTTLLVDHTKVTDLSLLKGMPLKELSCDFRPERDAKILRDIKTLETINGKPAAEFWKEIEKE